MRLDKVTSELLDFPLVLEQVAKFAYFALGRELVLALQPADDVRDAQKRLRVVAEARKCIAKGVDLSLGGVHDIRPLVRRAIGGGRLEAKEILDIRDTLLVAKRVRDTLAGSRAATEFPRLWEIAEGIDPCPSLVSKIEACVADDGQILDSASPSLARVRSSLRDSHKRLLDRLHAIVMSPQYESVLQDKVVTQREGRYVIPVKAQARSQLPGLVHDQSASGATLFVEPLEIVELTNRWKAFQRQEEREVARVLDELSRQVALAGAQLERDVGLLGEIDKVQAVARYCESLDASEPELVDPEGEVPLDLRRARHPLIPADRVVPVDVWMRGFRIMVITGPNTGGKTATLKTVGLLTVMAMCGFHIPAQSGCKVPAVDAVLADIGDDQSIPQNLSTFSSHVSRISRILEECTDRSLVLLDELGAGTDPEEGSALARALLSHLLKRRSTVLATSHHRDVKLFAYATDGVENASVEFDLTTLRPTYRLIIGLPGSSHALTIARRLGLPDEIVDEAQNLLTPATVVFEGLVQDLEREIRLLEQTRARLEEEESEARMLKAKLEDRLKQMEHEVHLAREQAVSAVTEELSAFRQRIQSLLKAAEAQEASRKWYRRAISEASRVAEELVSKTRTATPAVQESKGLSRGDKVWVPELQADGEVVNIGDGKVLVAVGNLLVSVDAAGLSPLPASKQGPLQRVSRGRPSPPPEQLLVTGMRTEEAEVEVERYLNRACIAGLARVRIVHGVGSGALRNHIRNMLRRHPLVASIRPGAPHEGGDGVTIVEVNSV